MVGLEKRRYRIVETIIRGKQSFVIEYNTINLLIYRKWKPILMCEDFNECIKTIERLISLKIHEF